MNRDELVATYNELREGLVAHHFGLTQISEPAAEAKREYLTLIVNGLTDELRDSLTDQELTTLLLNMPSAVSDGVGLLVALYDWQDTLTVSRNMVPEGTQVH